MSEDIWTPDSWRKKRAPFQPDYPDPEEYGRVCQKIASFPPLVFPGEIDSLRRNIARAAEGKAFILQGGDCVERFEDCRENVILDKVKILLQMSVILIHALHKPVIRIGRIAGQYFKPRSRETEPVAKNGDAAGGGDKEAEIMTYRGDGIHRFEATAEGRVPDPGRLLEAFYRSGLSLNYIRSLVDGGFSDLHSPHKWRLSTIRNSDRWKEYHEIVERILEAIHFMETFGGVNPERLARAEIYTSHEGLHLGYEQALTRQEPVTGDFYNAGAHMLWVGERTRDIRGAHAEYLRGITNPVGVKVGAGDGSASGPEDLIRLCGILNPKNEPGKIVLITRMGADRAEEKTGETAEAVKRRGIEAAFICDPMHGNTGMTASGKKTRSFNRILEELTATHRGLAAAGVPLAGVHFEMTGEDVTECTGGAGNLRDRDLEKNYATYCDPRLNYAQSLEMAFLIAGLMGPG